MTETKIEKGVRKVCVCECAGGGVLADSPALHGSLTVSPMFILFVGGGVACCSVVTHTVAKQHAGAYAHPQVMAGFYIQIHHQQRHRIYISKDPSCTPKHRRTF